MKLFSVLLVLLGWRLGPLGSLLEASWGYHRASWQLLGGLLGLLASSLGLLAASWEPLGGLLGASCGLLAGLEAEKWPWLEREHDF